MAAVPYKVYIVVDLEFGEKLAELERGVPVWIVDTPTNKPVAQRFWNVASVLCKTATSLWYFSSVSLVADIALERNFISWQVED